MKKLVRAWQNMPASAKSSICFAFCTFFLKGISFITTPVFTRIMDQSQYGIITTYNSWLSILEVFALLGLTSAGVLNVGLNDYSNSRDQYISSLLGLTNITTALTFALLFIAKFLMGGASILPTNLLLVLFIHMMIQPAFIFWITRQRYEFNYVPSTLVTIGSVIASQILAIVCVMNAENNLGSVKIWANELGSLLFAVPIYFMLLRKGRIYINPTLWKSVLVFALPLIPHYLAQHVMGSADRIMIANLVDTADAGIYGVVANIGMIAVIVWNAVNASLIPITFESINRNDHKNLQKTVNSLLSGYGVVCIGVVLIAPEVLAFLAPKEYSGGLYAIPPLVAVSFLNALYNVYANVEFYYKKSRSIATATIVAAIINVVLNYWLIPHYSYVGAAYTTLISNAALILMHYYGYKRCNNKIYNDRFILLLTCGMIAFSVLGNILYQVRILRLTLIAGIVISTLVFSKKIIRAIKAFLRK